MKELPKREAFLQRLKEMGEELYDEVIDPEKLKTPNARKRIMLPEFLFYLLKDQKQMHIEQIKKRAVEAGWMPNSVSTCLSLDPRFTSNDYGLWSIGA